MPIKCRYKPNRSKPRTWNEKAVIRVGCDAISDGESYDAIVRGLQKCAKKQQKEDDCERLRAAVRHLLPIAAGVALVIAQFVPILRVIQRVAITAKKLWALLPKPVRDSVQKQIEKAGEYNIIEGEFSRILDDIRVIAREFPPENLPRG